MLVGGGCLAGEDGGDAAAGDDVQEACNEMMADICLLQRQLSERRGANRECRHRWRRGRARRSSGRIEAQLLDLVARCHQRRRRVR